MPEGRCDLILLGWTAFLGFNLFSDFLWSSSGRRAGSGPGASAGAALAAAAAELYRGEYRLELKNGTAVETGGLKLVLASQPSSVASVQMSRASLALLRPGRRSRFSALQADVRLSGIELDGAGRVAATGAAGASLSSHFGFGSCRLKATVRLDGGGGGTRRSAARGGGAAAGGGGGGGGGGAKRTSGSLSGEAVASDCGFSMSFTGQSVDIPHLTQKVYHYSIWTTVLTVIQIRCYVMQMRHTEEGPSAAKVSVTCVAMQALMDAYDSFLHLCLGLSSEYMFNAIAVVSLFKFVLFSLLEARYLLTIWRQRRQEAFSQGWDVVRRELAQLYSRFYGVLTIGLVLIYNNLEYLDTIVLVFQVYWVPQILLDAWQGSRSAMHPAFFSVMSATRALLVLYLWGCPRSVFGGDLYPRLPGAPSVALCSAVVTLQAAQVTVMTLQRRLGPRWFVPWACMPWAYNYHRSVRIEPGTDCVICMSELDPEDAHRVSTPCGHNFHRRCLEQWMDVKMECPTCRKELPPIQ